MPEARTTHGHAHGGSVGDREKAHSRGAHNGRTQRPAHDRAHGRTAGETARTGRDGTAGGSSGVMSLAAAYGFSVTPATKLTTCNDFRFHTAARQHGRRGWRRKDLHQGEWQCLIRIAFPMAWSALKSGYSAAMSGALPSFFLNGWSRMTSFAATRSPISHRPWRRGRLPQKRNAFDIREVRKAGKKTTEGHLVFFALFP